MHTFIPDEKTLSQIVEQAVRKTVIESLPEAIRKATRKKWLTTDEVMNILQVSRRQVQFLRDSGKLPFRQTGRTIRYDIDEVENYLNKGKVNAGGIG